MFALSSIHLGQVREDIRIHDDKAIASVADRISKVLDREASVQGVQNSAHAADRVEALVVDRVVPQHSGNAISNSNTLTCKCTCQQTGPCLVFTVRDGLIALSGLGNDEIIGLHLGSAIAKATQKKRHMITRVDMKRSCSSCRHGLGLWLQILLLLLYLKLALLHKRHSSDDD
mmetsp:Transcript_13475/g.29549  ORF Transcript_13475/g.29549 Transcript_13475/m.29549 type:complete len:173 (+) Transcript_13475:1539-2057(+)